MPRIKRYQLADVAYLVSQRGHNRLPSFYDGEDYLAFTEALKQLSVNHGCTLHAWSLIPDGYWVLLTPMYHNGVSKLMQTLGRLYVRYINRKYGRSGTLWSSRYHACLIEPSSPAFIVAKRFIQVAAYRNMIVSEEDEWPWQSPYGCAGAILENEALAFLSIESTLLSGLVYGSDVFLRKVESLTTLRTVPLKRGRPQKKQPKQQCPS